MSTGHKAPRDRGAKSPLTTARMAAGLTQAQLAERVGCKQVEISRWENGVYAPAVATLRKLSIALGCSVSDLIGE